MFTPEDWDVLGQLASEEVDGNRSLMIRQLIRAEANRRGLKGRGTVPSDTAPQFCGREEWSHPTGPYLYPHGRLSPRDSCHD